MKTLIFVLAALLLAQSTKAEPEGILGFVDDVFEFMCVRCKDIISTLDNVIENEPFKQQLEGFCRLIPEPTIQAICVTVLDTVVSGIYNQVKKLEPKPEWCTAFHLCNPCKKEPETYNIPTSPPFPMK